MPSGRASLAVAAIVLGAFAADLSGQRGQRGQRGAPPPTFRANVDLVQVDVVVLDPDGRPVRGLTKSDFTLLDRNQPQAIAAFEEISHTYAASAEADLPPDVPRDVADNATARADRLVVLAIDDMVPADRFDRIKELARQVVTELGRDASMALLTSSEARKVEVTENRALLLAQIDQLAVRSAYAPRVPRMTSVERGTCAPRMFEQAAQMLGPQDTRRKAFVYISPYCKGDLKEVIRMMSAHPADSDGIDSDMIRMIEAMRRANVAFYAIDPRGAAGFSLGHFDAPNLVGTPGRQGMEEWRTSCLTRACDPVLQSQDNMRMVAATTGGFAITNTDDFRAGLARLVDDFDHYYLLGFSPADRNGKGFRPIEVTVNRPGVTLRYRRGYAIGGPAPLPTNKDPMVQLSAGVLPRPDLPLRLIATPLPSAGKNTRVAISLEVRSPPGHADMLRDDLDVTILAVDLQRTKVSKEFLRPRTLLLPAPVAGSSGAVDYRVVTSIDLAPGSYQLRTSAKSRRVGASGSVYTTIDVPNYDKTPLALGGLTVGYADAKRRGAEATVMDAGILPFEPAFDRTFTAADELRLYCDIWRKDPRAVLTTSVQLIDERGRIVATIDGREAAGGSQGSNPHIDVTFALASLAPGVYRVRVGASDGVVSALRDSGIVVR